MTTDSLIEKLEAEILKLPTENPDFNVSGENYNRGLKKAISIIRQHTAASDVVERVDAAIQATADFHVEEVNGIQTVCIKNGAEVAKAAIAAMGSVQKNAAPSIEELTRLITNTRLSSVTDGKIVIDPEITARVIVAMGEPEESGIESVAAPTIAAADAMQKKAASPASYESKTPEPLISQVDNILKVLRSYRRTTEPVSSEIPVNEFSDEGLAALNKWSAEYIKEHNRLPSGIEYWNAAWALATKPVSLEKCAKALVHADSRTWDNPYLDVISPDTGSTARERYTEQAKAAAKAWGLPYVD